MTQAVPGAPQGDPTGPGMAIPPAPPGMGVPSMAPPAWPGAVPPLATASGGSGNVPPPPVAPPPAPPAPQPAPAPHGRRAAWLGRTLATIGGMRPDLVDEFPQERRDYIQMAFILFTTALEAFIAAAFAINMVLSDPKNPTQTVALSVLLTAGLVWALIIFNIDRLMVMGMEGLHRWSLVGPVLLRVVLAALIGFVMATPLVLQVFGPEINEKMAALQEAKQKAAQGQIEEAQTKLDAAQGELSAAVAGLSTAGLGEGVDSNPAVIGARATLSKAQTECNQARNNQALERLGQLPREKGGSEKGGDGPVAAALQQAADAACAQVAPAQIALDRALEQAKPTGEQVQVAQAVAQERVTTLEASVAQLQVAKDAAEAYKKKQDDLAATGLLTRLEALDLLTSSTSEDAQANLAGKAHWALIGLLVSIEILPVLFKLFKQWSAKPSAYECRWKDMDNAVLSRARVADRNELAVGELQSYQSVTQTKAMIDQQDSLNEHMIGEITGVQLVLMQRALADWAQQHGVPYTPSAYTYTPPSSSSVPQPPAGSGTSPSGGHTAGAPENGSAASPGNGSSTSSWMDDIDFTALDADLNDNDPAGGPKPARGQTPDDGW